MSVKPILETFDRLVISRAKQLVSGLRSIDASSVLMQYATQLECDIQYLIESRAIIEEVVSNQRVATIGIESEGHFYMMEVPRQQMIDLKGNLFRKKVKVRITLEDEV